MNASRAEIITAVATLRRLTDPRGHDLLDALQDLALSQCAVEEHARDLVAVAEEHAVTGNGHHSRHWELS